MDDRTIEMLDELEACSRGARWARQQPDPAAAWAACCRGEWMAWLAGVLLLDRRRLVAALLRAAGPPADDDEAEVAAAIGRWIDGGDGGGGDLQQYARQRPSGRLRGLCSLAVATGSKFSVACAADGAASDLRVTPELNAWPEDRGFGRIADEIRAEFSIEEVLAAAEAMRKAEIDG